MISSTQEFIFLFLVSVMLCLLIYNANAEENSPIGTFIWEQDNLVSVMTFDKNGGVDVNFTGQGQEIQTTATWLKIDDFIEVHRHYDNAGGIETYIWDGEDLVLVKESTGTLPDEEIRLIKRDSKD